MRHPMGLRHPEGAPALEAGSSLQKLGYRVCVCVSVCCLCVSVWVRVRVGVCVCAFRGSFWYLD